MVWDRETGTFQYLDGNSGPEELPELLDCWSYKGTETLEARKKLLGKYAEVISADLCEMNLVSNITGLVRRVLILKLPHGQGQ